MTAARIHEVHSATPGRPRLDDVADVIVIEPKDAFVHSVAALRAVAAPEWAERIFLPYDRLLRRGRVVRDGAARVSPAEIRLRSGSAVTADYVVLATGSTYPFPAKTDGDGGALARAKYRALHAEVARAERLLVLRAIAS